MTSTSRWHSADAAGLTVTVLGNQAGLALRGEADLQTVDTLREAIATLPADLTRVHLELAELSFIDVCSIRELIALGHRPARPQLILHHPPGGLTRLVSLLWPDRCQLSVTSGSGAADSSTVSVQARR